MSKSNDDYKTIRLPKPLLEKVDAYVKKHPEYVSRTDLIKEALRTYIKEFNEK